MTVTKKQSDISKQSHKSVQASLPQEQLGDRLLDAHVVFVKDILLGEELMPRVSSEMDHLSDWLKSVPFHRVINKEELLKTLEVCVAQLPLGLATNREQQSILRDFLGFQLNAETHKRYQIDQVWCSEAHRRSVEKIVDLQRLRNDLVESVLSSSVYAELISDILYNGIKDFILEENLLAKLPGLSSIIKMGKWGMSRTMPNVEAFIEGAAKTFIVKNIPNTISLSKRILDKSLSPDNIRRLAMDFWERVSPRMIADYGNYINGDDVADLVEIVETEWKFYSRSEHFKAIFDESIDYWLEAYGDVTLGETFSSLESQKALISGELEKYLKMWANIAEEDGVLDAMIRRQLAPFYNSHYFKAAVEELV